MRGDRSSRTVLVTDGGRGQNRSALAAVQCLATAGYEPVVTVSGVHSIAAASRYCAETVEVPPVEDPGYAPAVCAELQRRRYLAVLPASDAALLALGCPGAELVDKERLHARAAAAGFEVPEQVVLADGAALADAAAALPYPVVVKAGLKRTGQQRAAQRVDDRAGLPAAAGLVGPVVVQPFADGPIHSVSGLHWKGVLVGAVHQRHDRLWPPVCGDACSAVTTAPDLSLEQRLSTLLEGYDGVFQAEFAGDLLIDVNPRVYGSMALGAAAGVNLVALYCDLLAGGQVAPVRAQPGVVYRWWEGELRHQLSRWRAGDLRARDALRVVAQGARQHTAVPGSVDLGPVLARLRYAGRTRRAAAH